MPNEKKHVFKKPLWIALMSLILIFTLSAISISLERSPFEITDADFYARNTAKETLGKFLFFDKELSGNRNISCATCHHPFAGTSDGLSLSIGEGGYGLGVTRDTGRGATSIEERVPRNAPHLFNLGAKEFTKMFHDGRVAADGKQPSGFLTPLDELFPQGLDNALAAQAMFPVTSGTEMAGQPGENPIADAAAANNLVGPGGVWDQLAARLRAIDEYVALFVNAFSDVNSAEDITFVHAVNAIAAYEASAYRCTNTAFDQYNNGNFNALSDEANVGMYLFYNKAGCAECHSGKFQTDHQFHAIGVPQIGPGKGDNLFGYNDGRDDFGRERVTQRTSDRFKFRTPSLRQVVLTGPWGHDGVYNDLEAMVRHHLNAVEALENYDVRQAVLPYREDLDALDWVAHADPIRRQAIADAVEIKSIPLAEYEIADLMAFLYALTDFGCLDLRNAIPTYVPSGLPLAD